MIQSAAAVTIPEPGAGAPNLPLSSPLRIQSIDALRGLVLFTMVFVNDIAGVRSAPWWMKHYFPYTASGMTFVDVVFPAFLFIVGMSIPFAIGGRLRHGEPVWRTLVHILLRTLALLMMGVFMVNMPASDRWGHDPDLWAALVFASFCVVFVTVRKRNKPGPLFRAIVIMIRFAGAAALIYLALAYRGDEHLRLLRLQPFHLHTWGILGLIGWAYLVASIAYLIFGDNQIALTAVIAILLACFLAEDKDTFGYLANKLGATAASVVDTMRDRVGFGSDLGSHASITVGGLLLASILLPTSRWQTHGQRARFTIGFIVFACIGAMLLHRPWGINKNAATPAWCLWCSAITASVWLLLYGLIDVLEWRKPLATLAGAGQNMLLAYMLAEMIPNVLGFWHPNALGLNVLRSGLWALIVVLLAAMFNRLGVRMRI